MSKKEVNISNSSKGRVLNVFLKAGKKRIYCGFCQGRLKPLRTKDGDFFICLDCRRCFPISFHKKIENVMKQAAKDFVKNKKGGEIR